MGGGGDGQVSRLPGHLDREEYDCRTSLSQAPHLPEEVSKSATTLTV